MPSGFERTGKSNNPIGGKVETFPDIVRGGSIEIAPALIEQFARDILGQFKDDPRCAPEEIEKSSAAYAANFQSDFKAILTDLYNDRRRASRLESQALYYCTVAHLYLAAQKEQEQMDRPEA
jgi:hypothetical protein